MERCPSVRSKLRTYVQNQTQCSHTQICDTGRNRQDIHNDFQGHPSSRSRSPTRQSCENSRFQSLSPSPFIEIYRMLLMIMILWVSIEFFTDRILHFLFSIPVNIKFRRYSRMRCRFYAWCPSHATSMISPTAFSVRSLGSGGFLGLLLKIHGSRFIPPTW